PGQGAGGAGIQAGTLTSGAWDDNLNFDFYLGYVDATAALEQQDPAWPLLGRADRLEIMVTNEQGAPLTDAAVTLSGPAGELMRSTTRSDGRLFALPSWFGAAAGTPLMITATRDGLAGSAVAVAGQTHASVQITGAQATPPQVLDVALVIDTTGSMGDEMSYLKVELDNIVTEVRAAYPGVAQRYALVVYRDQGDAYVVRTTDFMTDVAAFTAVLRQQSAGGGGDYPEAPDQALAALSRLQWSATGAARMVFWVADAPHHAERTQAMLTDFKQSFARGVHIYPVASSGVDELTEFTMRTAAQLTGGRYLFLTDDSGIGDSHKEPTLPCYVVTTLQKAMLRMVFMELSGTHVDVAPADVLRSAGAPVVGTCALAGGRQVQSL
ncbi:MAG TPA: vWA domain-containing protein, partial [Polyangia bacterium]|nr:vWA domain-containing protein [Polyangia bacterium]